MRNGKFHTGRMKGVNPFMRYLKKEDILQHQVITYCRLNKIVFHHSPNEGRRSEFERFKYNYLGSDCGFPDLLFPGLQLVIELKVEPNRPSPAQKEWLAYFESIGWAAKVCYSYDEAIEEIIVAKKLTEAMEMNLQERKISEGLKNWKP